MKVILAYTVFEKMHEWISRSSDRRELCGGCFNKIPPQLQLDIRMHKKIIVGEYCGRIW
jgi:predicted  nucleic acid-binding Zn-ribbon protein